MLPAEARAELFVVVTLGHPAHPHPLLEWLLAPLTIVARLLQVDLTLLGDSAHKALMALHVPPLCVRVDHSILLPLAQTLILPLLIHLSPVEAVEDGVEHDLRVVAV